MNAYFTIKSLNVTVLNHFVGICLCPDAYRTKSDNSTINERDLNEYCCFALPVASCCARLTAAVASCLYNLTIQH